MTILVYMICIVLAIFFTIGCDLEVTNLNQPDIERAFSDPKDLISLVGGSYNKLYYSFVNIGGAGPMLSAISFEHSTWAACNGAIEYSVIPRIPLDNTSSHSYARNLETTWYSAYRAVSSATTGIRQLDNGLVNLSASREALVRAFGKFVQGVAHGQLAITFNEAIIFDETMDPTAQFDLSPAADVLQAALGQLDAAIALANANAGVTVPGDWTGDQVATLGDLALLSRSYKAYFRANMPRNPEQANQVDWAAVIADVDGGRQTDFSPFADGDSSPWFSWNLVYLNFPTGWSQMNYFIRGMADQSGKYQTWINLPNGNKHPILPGDVPFLIDTPDKRFPQGATKDDQLANPGLYHRILETWARPDRGTWRWSYYVDSRYTSYFTGFAGGPTPVLTHNKLQLIKAEALYRTGNLAGAAAIVNVTRQANGGLSATDPNGANTDCVPKLPSGVCGNLLEMLKWEKRLETYHVGLGAWYFDSRRWGDHMEGTFLQMPVPGKELEVLQKSIYTYGGVGGEWAAPKGTYGF